jgi:AbrB family looped-hinge helix DNA binding protein
MTKKDVELITKLGPKGQIVLRKEIRRAIGIKPGSMVRETVRGDEVIIRPVGEEEILGRVRTIAKKIGKTWPKGMTSTEIVKEQRR